jgi:hypothetical protein
MAETKLIKDHHLWTRDTVKNVSGDLTLDIAGDLTLDAADGIIQIDSGGQNWGKFDTTGVSNELALRTNVTSSVDLTLEANGSSGNVNIIADSGEVYLKKSSTAFGRFNMDTSSTLKLVPTLSYDLVFQATYESTIIVDKDAIATADSTQTAFHIDYDHTGITADGETIAGIGLDLDMNCESVTHVGTVSQTGIDLDMVATTDGTQTNTGLDIKCTGADNNYGMNITVPDVAGDYHIKLMAEDDVNDYATFAVANVGVLTIATVGSGTVNSDIILDADGDIILDADGGNFTIKDAGASHFEFNCDATRFRILDDTNTSDHFSIIIAPNGETTMITTDNDGALAHLNIGANGHVEFDNCAVGFDLETPTYNASDTDVSFITGNKQFVTFDGGNIADLNLIFPETSGNFVLLLKQDGTGGRTVTNYKAWDLVNSDAADGSATVKFAGGSNPDLTDDANHVDIISFFWDADNQIAYGVATLDFQF